MAITMNLNDWRTNNQRVSDWRKLLEQQSLINSAIDTLGKSSPAKQQSQPPYGTSPQDVAVDLGKILGYEECLKNFVLLSDYIAPNKEVKEDYATDPLTEAANEIMSDKSKQSDKE